MPLKLKVPYADKDNAKNLGAIWIQQDKVWAVPDHINDINPFKSWISTQSDVIVRKPYLLCISQTNCWKCGKETPMIALAAKNYWFFEHNVWRKVDEPTLFSYVQLFSMEVETHLQCKYPFFKQVFSYTVEQNYYGNTCINCGRLQGDFHHHQDFGGGFLHFPGKPAPPYVKLINLDIHDDYEIDARHSSMPYDPIFFPNNMQITGNQRNKIKVIIF